MYKVWIKRNYKKIQSIGEGMYKIVFKCYWNVKLVDIILQSLSITMQIWILLEKSVQIQVKPSKMEVVKIWNHQGSISILDLLAQLGKVPAWDHQIWNLLKKVHLVISISYILSWFWNVAGSSSNSPGLFEMDLKTAHAHGLSMIWPNGPRSTHTAHIHAPWSWSPWTWVIPMDHPRCILWWLTGTSIKSLLLVRTTKPNSCY
jgi:hypothetical protein